MLRLLSWSASINEVALSLGYNNTQSFNRFFKKYEGITPGEFRNKKPVEADG
ncbi:MAG TPA: helix-turn-helix domain-containing protein [Bacillota bacterium]|nr:helix-turn-helix domain-containing protein [Bacillota bacterium]